jgi:hypothetical protein
VDGAIATAFGCPFEGNVEIEKPLRIARSLVEIGVEKISRTEVPLCSTRHLRKGSPPAGGSILITSAPKSANILPQKGPAIS